MTVSLAFIMIYGSTFATFSGSVRLKPPVEGAERTQKEVNQTPLRTSTARVRAFTRGHRGVGPQVPQGRSAVLAPERRMGRT